MLFEADLSGADAQVVAWEANDAELKQWLRDGVDMHSRHCAEIGGETQIYTLPKDSHQFYKLRQSYKHATHAVHYVASPYSMSHHPAIGWSIAKATKYLERYLARRPGILEWHKRVEHDIRTSRTVTNQFGHRIIYFDRIDSLLPQGVAWIPQSTVALVCFKGALALKRAMPFVEILLQVHDSVVFQVPFTHAERYDDFRRYLSVQVPYPDPLTIPWSLAKSDKSWGDCKPVET